MLRRLRLLALAALLPVLSSAVAAPATAAQAHAPVPMIGASWYPEQWPEAQWDADLATMQAAHFSVVRVGEFAWARMEPADGRFDFAWLDRAIAAAARRGMRVVIGTPTAAPPVWLTEAHPDVLRVNEDGSIEGHGERRQFSFASATYRRYARRVAGELAKRYGHDPNVLGWQIDNEIGVPSFDAEAKARWAHWLQARYGNIDALNARWSTQYWSQHYERFDQVPLKSHGPQNPALLLDFRRFASDLWADYVGEQADAIRAHAAPGQFITTNSTAWNNNFNQYVVHRRLDMAAWDAYVPNGRPDWPALAMHHDLVRGYLRRNFWIMETQPGRVDWSPLNRSLDPGQTRELAWQAVGHGADALLYWQWRSAPNGQEQYHGTLVGPDGEPMPVYAEIARTGAEFAKAAPWLTGTQPVVAQVAIVYSQDSRWAIENERHSRDYDPVAVLKQWYRPLAVTGHRVDVLPPDADFSAYKLVLAPNLNVLDDETARRLASYVRAGGMLVLGPRSGMKDGDNALQPQRQPGPLAELLGGRVEYYYPLDAASTVGGGFGDADVQVWAETLQARAADTQVLARYGAGNGWLEGRAAALLRKQGKGRIAYLGAQLDEKGQAGFASWMATAAGLEPAASPRSDGLEVLERVGTGRRVSIYINHGETAASITRPENARFIAGDASDGMLEAHGVAVFATETP